MSNIYVQGYSNVSNELPCPLCGGISRGGDPCASCNLPYKVIESILNRRTPLRFLGVLGPTGAGKTVYLGMLLDMLARGVSGLHGLAQSPFTLSLHRNVILALERQRFPEKTPVESDRWDWVHCALYAGKSKTPYDIVTPDVAGEAVMGELENPGTHKTIHALIGGCAGLVVLVDVVQVIADGQGQELFAMQLVSYLDALKPRKRNRKIDVPVAIVFTKTDLWDEWIPNPEVFAKTNAPALYTQCRARLQRCSFYFSGVAGSTGRLIDRDGQEMLVPLRIEPRGIVEPFAWMINQLR
jgi:Double-GTPase 2